LAALTVGVALIKLLEQYDVEHVFGIPGVHTVELYRGLADSSIQHHTPRHEQGAGFMADGYARVSGKPGVCFVITGPGVTNLATPMGQALADSIPMLVISSVNDTLATPQAQGMLHEMPNQLAFSSEVSRFSQTISNVDQLQGALAQAFELFSSARPGPVHLQLPVSLLGSSVSQSVHKIEIKNVVPTAATADISAAAELLKGAKSPLILAGGGATGASAEIQQLAEKIDAPVHMTINSRGLLPHSHQLAVPATATLQAVRTAINQCDVVLALGTELAATDYDQFKDDGFRIDGKLIRCDIDPLQINNNITADIGLVGDVSSTVTTLIEQVDASAGDGKSRAANTMTAALAELTEESRRHIVLLESIRSAIPDCIFVGDSTQLIYSGNMIFNTANTCQWFNSSTGFGTLGYALPAATGAAIGSLNKPVVCLIGDGGMQFVLGELGALKDTGLAVAVLVWRNGGYREIKTSMESAGVSAVGVEFSVPDFTLVAQSYGITAVHAKNTDELCSAINDSYQSGQSVLIEVDEDRIMKSLSQ